MMPHYHYLIISLSLFCRHYKRKSENKRIVDTNTKILKGDTSQSPSNEHILLFINNYLILNCANSGVETNLLGSRLSPYLFDRSAVSGASTSDKRSKMGHTGSKMTKFRKSFRRMSLSKSRDNLKTDELKKIRHSRSLTNLTFRKKDVIKLSEEKKLRRNTVVISTNIPSTGDMHIEAKQLNGDSEHADEIKTNSDLIAEQDEQEIKKIESPVLEEEAVRDCSGVLALKTMDSRLEEMEEQIERMSHEDLFIYHSTLKDEIHNFWIKAYGIKEVTEKVKPKKIETIDYIKKLLHVLNNKMFQRKNSSDSYC